MDGRNELILPCHTSFFPSRGESGRSASPTSSTTRQASAATWCAKGWCLCMSALSRYALLDPLSSVGRRVCQRLCRVPVRPSEAASSAERAVPLRKWLAKKDGLTLEFVVDGDGVRSVSFDASVKVAKPWDHPGRSGAGRSGAVVDVLPRPPRACRSGGERRLSRHGPVERNRGGIETQSEFCSRRKPIDSTSATGTVTIVCPGATLQWRAVKQ